MTFKIGDFVRFVDEDLEGNITSFLGSDMVGVTDTDGFEIPVPMAKITHVYGQLDRDEEDSDAAEKKQRPEGGPFVTDGVELAITGSIKQGVATFYLVNETSYQLLVSFNNIKGQQEKGSFAGAVEPHSACQVYMANVSSIGNWPEFSIQILFHAQQWQLPKAPINVQKRIRPADLSTAKQQVSLMDTKAWVFRLDEPVAQLETDRLKQHFMSHRPVGKK